MHYFAVVLVPQDTKDIEDRVTRLLEPFAEREGVVFCPSCEAQGGTLSPSCTHCCGYGLLMLSNVNPNAKWHMWEIGGLYQRRVRGLSPERRRWLKRAKGGACKPDRTPAVPSVDDVVKAIERHSRVCALGECGAVGAVTGAELKPNTVRVVDLPHNFFCWALITPDGLWHERQPDDQWCGGTGPSPAQDPSDWPGERQAILDANRDCLAVGCDIYYGPVVHVFALKGRDEEEDVAGFQPLSAEEALAQLPPYLNGRNRHDIVSIVRGLPPGFRIGEVIKGLLSGVLIDRLADEDRIILSADGAIAVSGTRAASSGP